jgi:hypothetical protein
MLTCPIHHMITAFMLQCSKRMCHELYLGAEKLLSSVLTCRIEGRVRPRIPAYRLYHYDHAMRIMQASRRKKGQPWLPFDLAFYSGKS